MADLSQIPTDQLVQMLAAHPTLQAQPQGPQPSILDRIVASPPGRLIHDAVVQPVTGALPLLANSLPFIGSQPLADIVSNGVNAGVEKPYQASLAANRNTPGYAAARAQADQVSASRPPGFTDQLTAPFNPSIAGTVGGLFGGSLDAANANADSAAAAQADYQKNNPVKSFIGQTLGGLAAVPEGAMTLPATVPKQTVPTISDLNTAKKAAYAVVDNSPMKIAAPEIDQLHTNLQTQLGRMGLTEKTMPALAPKVATAMDALKDASATDQTLQGMDIQRRIAGIAAGSMDKTERAAARIVQDGIDGLITNLQPRQLSGPIDQAAIDALPEARDLANRSFKAQQLQDIIDKAKNNSTGFAQSGYENALRSGFRKLLNNDRGIARFNPSEVAAIKQVATGGSPLSATNLLRQVGKLSPQGAVPILAEIGMYGAAGPSALAVPAAGIAGRTGATLLQSAAARNAVNLAAAGRGATAMPAAAFQLPALTSRSAVPFGLLPMLANQTVRQ